MFVRVLFDVANERQYSRAFDTLGYEIEDLTEPFALIGQSLRAAIGEQFLTEGDAGGTRWQPLSPAYAAWKEQHFPGMPILVRTGTMRAAALDQGAVTIGPQLLRYEIDSDIAIYHQAGTSRMPQRKLVNLPAAVRRSWDRILTEWIIGLSRGPGWSRALAGAH